MNRKLGPDGARKLKVRLADLRAASRMADLRRGRPHALTGNFDGCFALDLDGGRRIVVRPTENLSRKLSTGDIGAVEVVFIGDYHD